MFNGRVQHWTDCCGETEAIGSAERKCSSDRKRTTCASENVDTFKEIVFGQKDGP